MRLAHELCKTAAFSQNGSAEIFRTPGYCLFLIPGILLGHTAAAALFLQIILSCVSIIMIYLLSKEIFKEEKAAWIVACLYAFEPLSMLYSVKILTETFFTFVLMTGVYAFIKFLKNHENFYLFIFAVYFTFLPYIRPVAYFLPIIFLIFLGLWSFQKKSFYPLAVFFLIFVVGIGFWHWRNHRQANYDGFSSVSQVNLYFFQGAAVKAQLEHKPFSETQKEMGYLNTGLYNSLHPEQTGWPASKIYGYMGQEGLKLIREYPWIYFKIHMKGVLKVLLDPAANEWLKLFKLYPENGGLLSFFNDNGFLRTFKMILEDKPLLFWLNMGLACVLALYYLAAFLGLIYSKGHGHQICLLLLVVLYFVLMSAGPQSMARFRHPVMPFISLMAGWGVYVFNHRRSQNKLN